MSNKQRKTTNRISDETGQYDARFMLWRAFCAEHDVPVDTLPSDLNGEIRDKWEKMKNERLHAPAEKGKMKDEA